MESRKPVLKQRDYLNTTLRSYFLQNGFNYNSYQGTGYLFVILPVLKKIYKDDPEKLKEYRILQYKSSYITIWN